MTEPAPSTPEQPPSPRRRGATTHTQADGVTSGAVAPDHTDPVGEPHPPVAAQQVDTGDTDADLAFDPSTAGGAIPAGGLWMQLPTFMDRFQVPVGGQVGETGAGEDFVTVRGDKAVHVPAEYVQQVRTAAWNSFPHGGFTVVEFTDDPNPPAPEPSTVTSLDY